MWANFTGVDFLGTGLKHVVVVQKSVMDVQSCCCANQTYCFFFFAVLVAVAVAFVVAKAPY